MNSKAVSGMMVTLLLIGMLTLAFNIQPAKASGTIYIRPDGSVDPKTALIQRDGNVYTFTDNIYETIWVEESNIIIDGGDFMLQGPGTAYNYGVHLSVVRNVTVNNINIKMFFAGVIVNSSSGCTLICNTLTSSSYGILLGHSSSTNIVSNIIKNNDCGIWIYSDNNNIYHNNFINNVNQVNSFASANIWDNGYPSGGNYWSDYEETYPDAEEIDNSGIWNIPYWIDENNQDNYPLMKPWGVSPEKAIEDLIKDVESMNLQQGVDNSLDAKLDAVLKSLEALNTNQRNDAINKLYAFINEVEAQRGNKITNEQADNIISEAQRIIDLIEG